MLYLHEIFHKITSFSDNKFVFWEPNSVERYDEISETYRKLDILARIIWIAIDRN